MRALFIAPLSAVLLTGCLTTQENPNYEHSTVYKGDGAAAQQHANSTPVAATSSPASYQSVPSTYSTGTSYSSPTTYSAPSTYSAPVSYESATSSYSAPTTYESAPIYVLQRLIL